MNKQEILTKRIHLQSLLNQCESRHIEMFRKMYYPNIKNPSINEMVDCLSESKLNHAIRQAEKTVNTINNIVKDKEYYFKELLNYLTIKEDKIKYPDYIFYFKDDRCYFEYNTKNNYFYVNYDKVWKVFETKYHMNYNDTQSFIKKLVEDHFKLRGIILGSNYTLSAASVEEHFNKK